MVLVRDGSGLPPIRPQGEGERGFSGRWLTQGCLLDLLAGPGIIRTRLEDFPGYVLIRVSLLGFNLKDDL